MLTQIFVPRVNANDDTVVIVEWSVPAGARVDEGTPIALVETSKATVDVTATAAGYLYPEHEAGAEVAVGALMATVSPAPLSEDERRRLHDGGGATPAAAPAKVTAKARKLLQEHGLSEADFPGTARISVEDVERLLRQRAPAPAPAPAPAQTERPARELPGNLERLELSASKRREVRALVSTIAAVVPSEVVVPVDLGRFQRHLARLSDLHQYPLTVSDVVLHLCGQLLPRYPALNGVFEAGHPYRYKYVNVGFILNTGQGIEVPVISDVDRLTLVEVAREVRSCILKYTKGQLTSRDCSNGSFTVTDLSGEDVPHFRPVLNAMQSAILGIGMHRQSGQLNLILAFDHRMADGLLAARFLNELRTALEGGAEARPAALENGAEARPRERPRTVERLLRGRSRTELLQAFKLDQLDEEVLKAHLRRKKEVRGVLLSHRQAGFWVLQRMAPATTAYNASIGFTVEHLDLEKFEAACRLLLEEHPFLGSLFAEEGGAPVQLTPAEPELAFSYEEAELDDGAARDRLRSVVQRPFALDRGPLCRIHVCQGGARTWVLLCVHHILIDGYSTPPLLSSLFEKYARLVRGEVPRLLPPRADHAAFAAWERDLVDGPAGQEHRAFWLAELDGPLPHLELPTDRPRGRKPSTRGATLSRWLESGRAAALEQFAQRHEVSRPAVFLAAFATLLHHYTGQDDIIIGVPGRGRPPEFTDAVGCFMNMLPVRVRGIATRSFLGTSQRARSALLDGLYHGDYPFQAIVRELARRQPLANPPVFQVACVYQDLPFARLEQELGIQLIDDLVQEGQYELSLEIVEKAGRYRLHLKYDVELFDAATLAQVMEDYLQLLDASLADPAQVPARGERRRFPLREPSAAPVSVAAPVQPVPVAAPVQPVSTPERARAVEAVLLEIWRDALRTPEIRPTDRFAEVGGTSTLAVVVADRISSRFGCEVDVTTLFKCPTVAALTAHLLANAPVSASAPAPAAPERRSQPHPARDDSARPSAQDDRLAIIGMSCCFPGARDHREFWENLRHGRESATWFSPDELRAAGVSEATIKDPHYVPVQYSLRGKGHFDAGFFRVPAKNATQMDPQGRLLLMHAWKAVEDAGYVPEEIPETAVYVATTNALYLAPVISGAERRSDAEVAVSFMSAQVGTIPTTISYHLGLRGPSVFVGTNCSSSLVALHAAAQSLRSGDARLALVGAASISSLRSSDIGYVFQEGMNFSSDGHCRAFDAGADGMVPGEGVGVILVKRAADALADGDRIYAFVRATGINNDGAEKMGFHAPSVVGQSRLVEQVLARSGVAADTISYVEAHGTGTKLGDPVEVKALTEAYRRHTDRTQYCGLGSVKPNIGHLDAAAGLAGLIKLSLCLSKAELPPTINYERPNPAIDFARTPFFVVTDHRPWPPSPAPRRAAINSLGIGGTNAHAILEEHRDDRAQSPAVRGPMPFPLSARTDERLRAYASELAAFLAGPEGSTLSPADVAFTLQRGRRSMERRLLIVADDLQALHAALTRFARDGKGFEGCYATSADAEEQRAWPELAQRWVNGAAVDWSAVPGSAGGWRVSLPTYPFEEKTYWVSEAPVPAPAPPSRAEESGQTRVLAPLWCPVEVPPSPTAEAPGEVLVVGGTAEQVAALRRHYPGLRQLPSPEEALGEAGNPAHVVWIADAPPLHDVTAEHVLTRCNELLLGVFRFVRARLAARGGASRPLRWTFVTTLGQAVASGDEVDPCHAALHGLVGSLAKELPQWRMRLLDVERGFDFGTRAWLGMPWSARGDAWALRAGRWHALKLAPVGDLASGGPPYKYGGVYVVVGGAGGVGELWSRWMIEHYRAQLVWIGRREEDAELRARLDALGRLGVRPVYVRADATERGQLEAAYRHIKSRFPELHGVVHSAVGVFDQAISEVDERRFQEILSVKVDLSVRLAQVFGSEKLDFALFFSSIAAFEKAGGLAGYAAGSCFEDAFAERLAAQWPCPVKVVDWGYWPVGTGAALAPQARQRLAQGGIAPLEVESGMRALQDLIGGPFDRLVVVKTNRADALDGFLAPERLTVLPGPPGLPGVPQPSAADLMAHEQFARGLEGSLAENAELMQRLGELLGSILHEPDLRSRASQLSPMYRRWYESALELLASVPGAAHSGGAALAERWDRWTRSVTSVRANPELAARARLADACLRALPDILQGRRSATSVMFPGSSMELVEGVYKHNRGADHYNATLADVVAAYVARRLELDRTTPLRLIEVGAGTGGTSEALLQRLEPLARHIGEYAYTDVSKAFLFHAERHYKPRYPYLTTRLFDITKEASAQSLELGAYDVLIAANVIHATPDIRATLRNLKQVLRKGGLLALNEISDRNLFAHVTFGLLEGWWNAVDAPLRMAGSPGLTPAGWRRALAAERFTGITFPAASIHDLGQQLVVAQSDGVLRHGEAVAVAAAPRKAAPEPAPAAGAQGLRAAATRYLRQLFADVLKVNLDEIGSSTGFDEQGLDSIIFSQINGRLAADFPGTSTNLFFEHRTIDSLVEHLLTEHGALAAERFSSAAPPSAPPSAPTPSLAPAPRPSAVAPADEPIAIIGLSCRFPQADSLEAYWAHLEAGRACLREVPAERWSLADFYEPDPERAVAQARSYCRRGGFIDGFADFDPLFFNISPLDVRDMDPQERWVLTCCWEALEDAGYSPRTLRRHQGATGVFVGVTKTGFNLHTHRGSTFADSRMPVTSFSSMANRVSYHLDLSGPSLAIDTMCSSSLTALHQACESLRRGSCRVAIVGSANLYLHPRTFTDLCLGRMLTPDEAIECFSAAGRGFLPGEGVAAVVLKPLSAAKADGDRIEAVIRGTAVNHGGRTNGYTVPSLAAQRDLLSEAISRSGYRPEEIQYVESAANGSALADANEFHALRAAVGGRRETSCLVGTVKPNIGHLEATSGLSQLFKVVMQLRHRRLAPTRIGAGGLNPALDWSSAGLQLVTEARPWPAPPAGPRTALVMSVGAGGSNAAIVVEEHVSSPPRASQEVEDAHLVLLSARTTEQVRKVAERLASHLSTTDVPMGAVAYTLATGRQPLRVRRAFVARSRAEAARVLASIAAGEEVPGLHAGDSKGHAERVQAELDAAVEQRDLQTLARWWVQGHDAIDWERLYPYPRRCRLPTYPFEQRRFWYEPLPPDEGAPPGSANGGPTPGVPDEVRASIVTELKSVLLLDDDADIDAESTFLELGLDSLGVVRFMQALAQRLERPLPATLVFDYPTLGALASYLAEHTGATRRSAPSPVSTRTPFERHVAQVIRSHPEVVPLQVEGEGDILFCVHPMSGDVGLYQKLADASERRFRVIGLKARGWLPGSEPLRSIEAMAAHYASAIEAVQPEGPLHLFGASMGGTVAYEAGRELLSRGRRVGALFLAESPVVEDAAGAALWDSDARQNLIMNANFLMITMLHMDPEFRRRKAAGQLRWADLELRADSVAGVPMEELPRHLVELVRRAGVRKEADGLVATLRSMATIHLANLKALNRYRASPLTRAGGLTAVLLRTHSAHACSPEVYNPDYLLAVQRAHGSMAPFFQAWARVLPELETRLVPGENHFDLMNTEAASRAIADRVVEHMRRAPAPLTAASPPDLEGIAIIGMSGRFPDADDVTQFWRNVRDGRDSVRDAPVDRGWNIEDVYDPRPQTPGKTYARKGGFLSDVQTFDPLFFNITPRDAALLDPSVRLFLQESWRAIEDAGYAASAIAGQPWGVFACAKGDYAYRIGQGDPTYMAPTDATASGLLSYFLDLVGPSLTIDTACSSTLAAVALACDSLAQGQCTVAIAGGGGIYTTPNMLISSSQSLLYSPDGKCYTFDERANGTVMGEAVTSVVLKPLRRAVADGDRIHGVIRGWGINQDGKTNGLAAPSAKSQSQLQEQVYRRFRIDPATITLVEAHGTGTKLGDPIEVRALTQSFRRFTQARGYCALGSVKTNIGHTFFGAGAVGLVKVLGALRHRQLPPTLNFETLNSQIQLADSPFYVNTALRSWEVPAGIPRRAAINAFGATGTNVHLVVDEWPESPPADAPEPPTGPLPIVLSAKTPESLQAAVRNLRTFVMEGREGASPPPRLEDVAFSLAGRTHMSERLAFMARDLSELEMTLGTLAGGGMPQGCHRGRAKGSRPNRNDEIPKAYVEGEAIDWERVFRGRSPRRLRLPTYAFARERCWLDMPAPSASRTEEPARRAETLCFERAWSPAVASPTPGDGEQHALLCDFPGDFDVAHGAGGPRLHVTRLSSAATNPAEHFRDLAAQLLAHTQALLAGPREQRALVQLVVRATPESELTAGLGALLLTAAQEDPRIRAQVVRVPQEDSPAAVRARLVEARAYAATQVHWRAGRAEGTAWAPAKVAPPSIGAPFKEGGVYLVTGGAGGLGQVVAQAVARSTRRVTLLLAGRSQPGPELRQRLDGLGAPGAVIRYEQCDVSDPGDVRRLVRLATEEHGGLNGVFHCAGVTRDSLIRNKRREELDSVFAAKVSGVVALDEATRGIDLDFFILFSSGAGALGNVGQADYAMANAFLDGFAELRNQWAASGARSGHTLSVGWPLWRDGGMKVGASHESRLRSELGIVAMPAAEGIHALVELLRARVTYACVVHGYRDQVEAQLASGVKAAAESKAAPAPAAESNAAPAPAVPSEDLRSRVLERMRSLVADVIKLDPARLDTEEPLAGYGIDSIVISELMNRLAAGFGGLPRTLFYEHQSLAELAVHLVSTRADECITWTGGRATEQVQAEERPTAPARSHVRASDDIAIIGVAARFPGGATPDALWRTLLDGASHIKTIPSERWSLDGFYEPLRDRALRTVKSYLKHGAFLEDFSSFDPLFFGISPSSARDIDPHERLMLMCCWHALEDSGYSRGTLRRKHAGNVGVFIGVTKSGFALHTHLADDIEDARLPLTSFGSIANRVSYSLDLQGPSLAVDTMCSSSLTALHEACEHIRRGDCEVAFAGAVNLYLHPRNFIDLCQMRMASGDGQVHCFSKDGDGFVPGEGVAAILLKPLNQALADGDDIRGVISGSALNHGGLTHGYSVPSLPRQREIIERALARAGCSAADIDYVESAANGSSMGDAIELEALGQVFGRAGAPRTSLGSVKPNLGHLEAASGLSQLCKVLLQLEQGCLAPTLFDPERLDPKLTTEDAPLRLVDRPTPWKAAASRPRTALITSFGAGGSYAATVVREPPAAPAPDRAPRSELIVLSARTEDQLTRVMERLHDHLSRKDEPLDAVAWTLQQGRDPLRYRAVRVVDSTASLVAALASHLTGTPTFRTRDVQSAERRLDASLDTALAERDLETLGALWLEGADKLPWEKLHRPSVRRCRLPGYPFDRRSFWYGEAKVERRDDRPRVKDATAPVAPAAPVLPGADELRRHLMAEIRSILMLRPEDPLDPQSTFLELGLDSITALRFMRRLSDSLGRDLRETLVFEHPTVEALARHLLAERALPASTREPAAPRPSAPRERLAYVIAEHPELVPLQLEGNGPLLFCIHPMSGDVGLYEKLAEASRNRFRMLGLRAKGFLTDREPLDSIPAIARYYAEIATKADPSGPYRLFGSSMGGTVAYELARQLQERGKQVERLILVEPPLVENDADGRLWDSDERQNWVMNANFLMISMLHFDPEFRRAKEEGRVRWSELALSHDEIAGLDGLDLVRRLVERIEQRGVKAGAEVLRGRLVSMARTHLANLRALRHYRATPLPQAETLRSLLLRTRSAAATSEAVYNPDYLVRVQQAKGSMEPFLAGWARLLPGMRTTLVDGDNHFELLGTRHVVQSVADHVASELGAGDRTEAPRARPAHRRADAGPRIAVIGMSARFPGAANVDAFWRLLERGECAVGEFPTDRGWDLDRLFGAEPGSYVRRGGFLQDIAGFDPGFFRITPREAELLDPTERLFLQESWRAIEDAGVDPTAIGGRRWGVFCGAGGDYGLRLRDLTGIAPQVTSSSIPGRVAYTLDLTGPVLSLDAGCASSLVAVSHACEQLAAGSCDVALAGGALVYSTPNLIVTACQARLFSPDGLGRVFDAGANGMVPGEAVAVLVLKPLPQALEDGDRIYGVLDGWGSNHNGKTSGMASPNGAAQRALYAGLSERFDIDPSSIDLVEANANGSPVGDVIEVQSLNEAFTPLVKAGRECVLGSVEGNIGHAFQASGMGHLVKVLLALHHQAIPPTVGMRAPHPSLRLAEGPFRVTTEPRPWLPSPERPRRAAISSFGATGANAHLVLSEAPAATPAASPELPVMIALSAHTEEGLRHRSQDLLAWAQRQRGSIDLARLSATLLTRRAHFAHRAAFVCSDAETLARRLAELAEGRVAEHLFQGHPTAPASPALVRLSDLTSQSLASGSSSREEDLLVMADLYCRGVMPKRGAVGDAPPLSLPGYPFAREAYWYGGEARREPAQSRPRPPSRPLQDELTALVSELTGYPPASIDTDGPLSAMGFDSLLSMRLLALIQERLRADLDTDALMRAKTIRGLAEHLGAMERPASQPAASGALPALPSWLEERLAPAAPALQGVALPWLRPLDGAVESELAPELAELVRGGIALARSDSQVFALAPRAADLASRLARSSELSISLPPGTLIAPTSREQRRNLFHSEVLGRHALNLQHAFLVSGRPLDLELLERALTRAASDHDILRTRYLRVGSHWVQVVSPEATLRPRRAPAETLEAFYRFLLDRRSRLLDVSGGPPLELWVMESTPDFVVGFVAHHATADAFTAPMLLDEVIGDYDALLAGRAPPGRGHTEQYWQYALRQHDPGLDRSELDLAYWRRLLTGTGAAMLLPYAADAAGLSPDELELGDGHLLELPASLGETIDAFASTHGLSLTQVFAGALGLLLTEGLGNERAVLRLFNNQRDRTSLFHALGEFSNVLFLPIDPPTGGSTLDYLLGVRARLLDSLRHARVDLEALLPLAGIDGLGGYYQSPGDVVLDSADVDSGTKGAKSLGVRSLFVDALRSHEQHLAQGQALATWFVQVLRVDGRIHVFSVFRKRLFDAARMKRLSELLVALVDGMCAAPQRSVGDLVRAFAEPLRALREQDARPPSARGRFPELVRLNERREGLPVFWIHAGLGGVELYRGLAAAIERPFFGIQARGWMTDRAPLRGIEAMASYYVHVLMSVQPRGPYDLGGYSLGGMLAYEVVRQLQELGEEVRSLVMLDTFDAETFQRLDLSERTAILQAANLALHASKGNRAAPLEECLVRRDELDAGLEPPAFLARIIELAKQRGMLQSPTQLRMLIQQMLKVQSTFEAGRYAMPPLPSAGAVRGYYVRNRGGRFYGDLSPYHLWRDEEASIDGRDYWTAWRALLPGLSVIDVDAANHMTLLAQPETHDTIRRLCAELYRTDSAVERLNRGT